MNNRRNFLKLAGLTGIGLTGGLLNGFSSSNSDPDKSIIGASSDTIMQQNEKADQDVSIIGLYGQWAASLNANKLPAFSFRRKEWTNIEAWRKAAKTRAIERLAVPAIGGLPNLSVNKEYEFDDLHIEEVTWQLPYGRATEAILLKPAGAKGKLPAILAFHDHGGNKYFGTRKITRTAEHQHPLMKEHQQEYYSNMAWANELAKNGYVVLVADAFTFGSRRVMFQDLPESIRNGKNDENPENADNIKAYNKWAAEHEHVMAKSLFCAGITWPGVFYAEDLKALDILCARPDVDVNKIGCGGLSGGGLRTVIMGGLDRRIKCAVAVGFMTTWKDVLLNKSYTHTWMTYVPLLPNELDFPEVFGLRAPLPTMVLNNNEDALFTLPEMNRAEHILTEVFKKAGKREHFKCVYYPGVHKFDSKMQEEAFSWFDRWLKV